MSPQRIRILAILRGLPGCGKSTLVKILLGELAGSLVVSGHQEEPLAKLPDHPKDYAYCSADDFFVGDDGVYRFNSSLIGKAHSTCQIRALGAMNLGVSLVIVDNTHTTAWEYALYQEMGRVFDYETVILDVFDGGCTDEELSERNSHGVALAAIERMRARYENDDDYPDSDVVVLLEDEE